MPRRTNTAVRGSGAQSVPATFEIASPSMQEAVQGLLRALEVKVEERLNELSHRMEERVETSIQQMEERVATLSQRVEERAATLEEKMEERVTTLSQQVEERVVTLAEQSEEMVRALEESLARVERRMITLEATFTASADGNKGQEAVVKKLEGRVLQLETSAQKALDGVIPRVDSLLQKLEGNCPPAPFAVASTASDSLSSLAPSPTVPLSTPWTASAPPPPFNSAKGIALGKELHQAAKKGRVIDVQRLLNEGANVDHRDAIECTPLMGAAFNGRVDVVSLLLRRGADVNAKTKNDMTALHGASANDPSGRCVKLLLDGGAHVQCKDRLGRTALHCAASKNNEQAVRLLIAAGASNTVRNDDGKRPSDLTGNSVIREILFSSSR